MRATYHADVCLAMQRCWRVLTHLGLVCPKEVLKKPQRHEDTKEHKGVSCFTF